MSLNGIQRYVTRIDLRTKSTKEKQEYVDYIQREYTAKKSASWQPTDLTEGWIKDSRGGELFQEFITRQLQENAQRKMNMELGNQVEYETEAHPLIEALTDLSEEARTVVWRLDNDVYYEAGPPGDSGGDIDKV
jgi:hypothetical protein